MKSSPTDYDGAWKEALEFYLQPFLELAFPSVAAAINWGRPVKFLNTELQEIVQQAKLGKQRADTLVEVHLQDGQTEWILIHVEVQSHRDRDLPRRMYHYHHRIADRYGRPVVSLAVLADLRAQHENWEGSCFRGNGLTTRREERADPQRSVTDEQRSRRAVSAKTLRAAGLLPVARVGSAVTARYGDAPASPPWPPPKSLAAGPIPVFVLGS